MNLVLKIAGLVLLAILVGITALALINPTKRRYHRLIDHHLNAESPEDTSLIEDTDLDHLPEQIQAYLDYVGVVGTPHVRHFRIRFDGEMKMDKNRDFTPFEADQTSFVDQGVRLFYMDMTMNGLKVSGLHHFDDEDARMNIKLLDVFPVVDEHGEAMRQAETVTFFNDMVLFAPQTLIDADIAWDVLDDHRVKASFTHRDITVEATLEFADDGRLVNFRSNDRLALEDGNVTTAVPWSTPISEYADQGGLMLPKTGEGTWHYDDGDFTYITLNVLDVTYND